MHLHHIIKAELQKTQEAITAMLADQTFLTLIESVTQECVQALRSGCKIMFVGNGGSAADAQHLAAELVSRLSYDRPALAALALTTDTSALTAIGNDYGFETLFSRQVESLGRKGDVLIGISTSGKSKNILAALQKAREIGIKTIGMTGKNGQMMASYVDHLVQAPSANTQKIQECHIILGHILCGLIEETFFGKSHNPARQAVEA